MAYENGTDISDSASLGSNPSSPATKNPAKQRFFEPGQSGQERPEGEPAPHKSRHSGHVYFIYVGEQKAFKIGHSTDLGYRLETLQTGNPVELRFQEVFRGSRALEKTLQKHFKPFRIAREWFREHKAIWDFLDRVEDYQLGFWYEHIVAKGRRAEFAAKKYPWHDLDIPEEAILALLPSRVPS